jgi:hypothetical protein
MTRSEVTKINLTITALLISRKPKIDIYYEINVCHNQKELLVESSFSHTCT